MKNIFPFLLVLSFYVSFAQKESADTPESILAKINSEEIEKISDSIDNNYSTLTKEEFDNLARLLKTEKLKSLAYCNLMISKFPNSELVFDALYKKAFITYEYLDVNDAREIFLKVVEFDTKKTAYKRRAYRILASIEIEKKNYFQAIFFLDESSKYNVLYFCGTAMEIDTSQIRNIYTICFNGISESK